MPTVTPTDAGLRARKKKRTRQDLVAVALRLFVEQGFDATTIEQIAANAEVSPRTFFRYFPTKEDVLFGEHDDEADQRAALLLAGLRARPAEESTAHVLCEALLVLASSYENERDQLLLRKAVIAATPALRARALERREGWEETVVDELLRRLANRGDPDTALNVRVTVAATTAALHAAIDVWLDSEGRATLSSVIRQAFDHLAGGLKDARHSARPVQRPLLERGKR